MQDKADTSGAAAWCVVPAQVAVTGAVVAGSTRGSQRAAANGAKTRHRTWRESEKSGRELHGAAGGGSATKGRRWEVVIRMHAHVRNEVTRSSNQLMMKMRKCRRVCAGATVAQGSSMQNFMVVHNPLSLVDIGDVLSDWLKLGDVECGANRG